MMEYTLYSFATANDDLILSELARICEINLCVSLVGSTRRKDTSALGTAATPLRPDAPSGTGATLRSDGMCSTNTSVSNRRRPFEFSHAQKPARVGDARMELMCCVVRLCKTLEASMPRRRTTDK